jgi:hypothetical protein
MANSYPLKIGTKLGDAAASDYQPDGRVYPGHLTGRQDPTQKVTSSDAVWAAGDYVAEANQRTAIFRLPDIARSA